MHKLTFILLGVFVILATTSAEKDEKQVQSKSSSELQREVREAERNENRQKNLDKKAKRKSKRKEQKRNNRKKNTKKNTNKGRRKNIKAAGRRTAGGRASTTVSDTCFFQAMKMMKIWKDNIGNFEKQENRMKIHNKTSGNKSGKKGLFGPVVQRIIEAGGGNRSNMSCAGRWTVGGIFYDIFCRDLRELWGQSADQPDEGAAPVRGQHLRRLQPVQHPPAQPDHYRLL